MNKQFEARLTVLMSQEEGHFYAHCLAFDLLAEGNTEQQAKRRLEEMIFEYIRFYLRNSLEQYLFRPAAMKYWNILRLIQKTKHNLPVLPQGLLKVTSPNRIARYLDAVNVPAGA